MLDISKTFFWFAFGIALLVIAGYGGYVLYNLAKTIREAKKTLKDVNKKLEKIDILIDSIVFTVDTVKTTVQSMGEIIRPATIVSKLVQETKKIIDIFRRKPEEKK